MSSSSPGKWNKNNFLPQIKNPNRGSSSEHGEDFDIDSFDKLLDELTHENPLPRNTHTRDERISESKMASDFHLPSIESTYINRAKSAMERKRKQAAKYSKLDAFQQKSYGLGKRSLRILNKELRSIVTGGTVPLPPMKSSLLSSIIDPMESIPEEPSNTSVYGEVSLQQREDSTDAHGSKDDKPFTLNTIYSSDVSSPLSRSSRCSEEVVINSFYDDALKTDITSNISSRWSSTPTFDCRWDPSDPGTHTYPCYSNARPRAPKRTSPRIRQSAGENRTNIWDSSYTQSFEHPQREINQTMPETDIESQNVRPSSLPWDRPSDIPNGNSPPNSCSRGSGRQTPSPPDSRQSYRSIDDWLRKSVLSKSKSPSTCSSLSVGTLAPIQEVSSSSENSSSVKSSVKNDKKQNLDNFEDLSVKSQNFEYASSMDTTEFLEERDAIKTSPYTPCIDNTACPLKDLNRPPTFNVSIQILTNTREEMEKLKLKDSKESEVRGNDTNILLEKKNESSASTSPKASAISQRSSSSSSQERTKCYVPYLSEPNSETIGTHISENSMSDMPSSGSLRSKRVEKERELADENQSVHSLEKFPFEKSKYSSPTTKKNLSHSPSDETIQGQNSSDTYTDSFSTKYNEDSFHESLPEIECDSPPPPSCSSWKIVSHEKVDQALNVDNYRENTFFEHENSMSQSHHTEVLEPSVCENKITTKNTSLTTELTDVSSTEDPLKSIPCRNPQSYIASWRTFQHIPQNPVKYVGSHEIKPLSHISEGSTYSLSSSWKILSSDDGKNTESCRGSENMSNSLPIHNPSLIYLRNVVKDTFYTSVTSPDSCVVAESKSRQETHKSSPYIESRLQEKCLVVYKDQGSRSSKPEVTTSSISMGNGDSTLINSLTTQNIICEEKETQRQLVNTSRKNLGFKSAICSDAEESNEIKSILDRNSGSIESYHSLQKWGYQVTTENSFLCTHMPSTESNRSRAQEDTRKSRSAGTARAETYIMGQPLHPPVAACYVNYPQISGTLINNRSLRTRPVVRGSKASNSHCNSAQSTSVTSDASLVPQNLQSFVLTSNNRNDLNNQNTSRSINRQHYLVQSHMPIQRHCGILSIDSLKHPSIPSYVMPQSENTSDRETILINNNFNDPSLQTYIPESVVYDYNESPSSESTQVTVMENTNYFFVTPTEPYISTFTQPLSPGTMFVSTRTSKDNSPLFSTPSEHNYFPGAVTQILVTSDTSIGYPEIIEIPVSMDNVFVTSSLPVSTQKIIIPPEDVIESLPFDENLHQFQTIPTAICERENSCGEIVESCGIEIIELTSVNNDESKRASEESMLVTEHNQIAINMKQCNDSEERKKPSERESNEKNCSSMINIFSSDLHSNKVRSRSEESVDPERSASAASRSTRSPSPVSSFLNESEKINSAPPSEATANEDTQSVTSGDIASIDANVSIRSSPSCEVSTERLSTNGSEHMRQSDSKSDGEMRETFSHKCLPTSNIGKLSLTNLVQCDKMREKTPKIVSKCESSQYYKRTEKYNSESLKSLSIESIARDDSNLRSCSSKIPRSPSIPAYLSSDFDSSKSSSISRGSSNLEEKDSLSSVIMGTPPKTSSRLPPALTQFNCDYTSPHHTSSESTDRYSDSDFEHSPSCESLRNPLEYQYLPSTVDDEHDSISLLNDENIVSPHTFLHSDDFQHYFPSRSAECKSDTTLKSMSSYHKNKVLLEKSSKEPNSTAIKRSPVSTVESSNTLQIKLHSPNDCDSDGFINETLINMKFFVNVATAQEKSNISETCPSLPNYQGCTPYETCPPLCESQPETITFSSSANSKGNISQNNNLTPYGYFPHVTKHQESQQKSGRKRNKFYKEARNVSNENFELICSVSSRNKIKDTPSNGRISSNETSSGSESLCRPITQYPSYHSHKHLNLKSDVSDICHKNLISRKKIKCSTSDSENRLQMPLESSDNLHIRGSKNFVTKIQGESISSESSASYYPSYNSHRVRKKKKTLWRAERKLGRPEISNESLELSSCKQRQLISKSCILVSEQSHASLKKSSPRSYLTDFKEQKKSTSDSIFDKPQNQSPKNEVSEHSHISNQKNASEKSSISRSIQKHRKSTDVLCTSSNIVAAQNVESRKNSSNSRKISFTIAQGDKSSKKVLTEDKMNIIENEAENTLSDSERNEDKRRQFISRAINQSESFNNDRGDLPASPPHPMQRKRCIDNNFQDSEKTKSILAHLWFGQSNESKISRYSPRKAPLTRRSDSTVTKKSKILKPPVLSEMAKSAVTFSRITAHFPTNAHLSPRIIEASLNSRIPRKVNEQTVDCLLPVRALRTYSLEAVSETSQLELALVHLKMQVRSTTNEAFMRNLGRCATSLVSLPHPSSKNAHPSDSCIGSYRSSFDSESSDTSNEEPKCQRRHTRPCVQIETKDSPQDFRTPLASSHAFTSEISSPVEVSENRIETIYSANQGKENKFAVHETGSKNSMSFKNSRGISDQFSLHVPSQKLLSDVSNEWLEIARDAPLDVLIGLETTESRPKSPPPHATRDRTSEVEEDNSIERLLGIDSHDLRPKSPPAHATRECKRVSNKNLSNRVGSVDNMGVKSWDALQDTSGGKGSCVCGKDRGSSAPYEISPLSKLQLRKNDPQRCVHFSPKVTYIARTRENSPSNTSKRSGGRSYGRSPIQIGTQDKKQHPDSESLDNRNLTRPYLKDSRSRSSHDRDVSSTTTVTLYRSEAGSDSSSYGLLSLHKLSHSSKGHSWCTADDSTDETLSNFSNDIYYPLPGLDDYPKIDSVNLGVPSLENQHDKLTNYSKERGAYSTRDSSTHTSRSLSSHMGLIRDTAIKSLLSASDSLGVSVANTEIPLALRRPNITSACDILSPPRPATRQANASKEEVERPSQYSTFGNSELTKGGPKRPSMPAASSSTKEPSPVAGSVSRMDQEEADDYYHVCSDTEMYNAFRLEKLYSGSSITDGTGSWPAEPPMLYRGKNPGLEDIPPMPYRGKNPRLEDIPSMGELRRPIRATTPPYGARYGTPYYSVRRELLEGGDAEATEAGQEQQRRQEWRRERRAERRHERQRQQLGVQTRRPFSGSGDVGRRRRRQRFTCFRQCFEGIGDALFTVFGRCCD